MGIAVLLGGGEGDRYAVLHAVALAQRTGEVIHGIRQEPPSTRPQPEPSTPVDSGLALLLRRADVAGVAVRCHVLEGSSLKDVHTLLREERIFCLIVGAKDEAEGKRLEKQLGALQKSITGDRRW